MQIIYILAVILVALFTLSIIRIWLNGLERKSQNSPELIEWLKELGARMERSSAAVDQKLSANMSLFNNRLDSASQTIAQVNKSIGEFSEIGRSMQQLQIFLQSPKLRGNIGEHILSDLLGQHFPSHSYTTQYTFKNGERVDAILKTAQGIIPIDAKFPLQNFRAMMDEADQTQKNVLKRGFERDVKKHIQDISKKYILSAEGTVDYAIMYIPSESVYYEIINNQSLFDFAGAQKVLPVSPMSFYAYMKAILMSFEGQRIQSQAKEILNILRSIKKDYEKTEEQLSVLTKHITNAYNQTAQVNRQVTILGQKIEHTHMISNLEDASGSTKELEDITV